MESGGVGNSDTLLSLRNFSVDLEVWHGALSYCNLPSGKCSQRNGNRWVRNTSLYAALLTDPLSRHIFVAPFFHIPAHTMTLKGCFAHAFSLGATPTFLYKTCDDSPAESLTHLSILHIQRYCLRFSLAHSTLFSLLLFLIIWQYQLL